MGNHEPWRMVNGTVLGSDSVGIFRPIERFDGTGHDKAQRAVACVNACAGLNPEAVPDLLAACKALLAEFDAYSDSDAMAKIGRGHEDYGRQRESARAAIAKAEAQP